MISITKSWLLPLFIVSILVAMGVTLHQNRYLLDFVYSPKIIYVKIGGNVKVPGIYKMESGDRLQDLLDRAGGFQNEDHTVNYDPYALLEDGGTIWLGDR